MRSPRGAATTVKPGPRPYAQVVTLDAAGGRAALATEDYPDTTRQRLKLVAVGTIEEKMEVLKERKGALAASLLGHDGEPTLAMTEADIEARLGA